MLYENLFFNKNSTIISYSVKFGLRVNSGIIQIDNALQCYKAFLLPLQCVIVVVIWKYSIQLIMSIINLYAFYFCFNPEPALKCT